MPVVELDCVDDFLVGSDLVFINDFSINEKCVHWRIQASAVEAVFVNNFRIDRDLVFADDYRRQPWNQSSLTIPGISHETSFCWWFLCHKRTSFC